ncbi:MAG: response regulator [Candidatus Omnitrophota bacterium]
MAKKILVVDDDRGLVALLRAKLKAHGYLVCVSYNGKTALEKVKKETPDLIILDVMMPKVNGFTVCSVLKSDEAYKAIPIVILTGRHQDNDREFDENVRPNAFFTKPFSPKELLDAIKQLMNQKQLVLS